MEGLLIWFVVCIGIVAVLWVLSRKVALPEEARIIIYVIMAIVAIVFLFKLPALLSGL